MATKIDTPTARNRLAPRREPYWSRVIKGGFVGYRRAADGGSWIARVRDGSGAQRYESLGTLSGVDPADQHDHACDLARKWFAKQGTAEKADYTVADACDDYIKNRRIEKGEKTAKDAEYRINAHIRPELGKVRLTRLTQKQVRDWRDSLVKRGDDETVRKSKDTANRHLATLKAILNHAYKADLVGSDAAWSRVAAFPAVGESRKVFLTADETTRLLKNTGGVFQDLVKAALLTGARYGELAGAKVRDFDPKHGAIRLTGKTGTRDCYLSDEGVSHFKALAKGKKADDYLLTKQGGTPWRNHDQKRPMREAIKAADLPADTTFYALRHTHISRALVAGVNIQVLAENCGTSVRMIEKHYGKFLKADRRAMMNAANLGVTV